jgi:hypothetical protein
MLQEGSNAEPAPLLEPIRLKFHCGGRLSKEQSPVHSKTDRAQWGRFDRRASLEYAPGFRGQGDAGVKNNRLNAPGLNGR